MQRFNISGCQKTISETNCSLSTKFERQTYDVNVVTKNHYFNIPLILDKHNIMIIMQKLKCMQEFNFAINVQCLIAVCMQNYKCIIAHVQNMQKHVFVAYK